MSDPDPLAKLRRFVPLLAILIVLQAAAVVENNTVIIMAI